jgi:hypothetical protein
MMVRPSCLIGDPSVLVLQFAHLIAEATDPLLQLPVFFLQGQDPADTFQVQSLASQVLDQLEALDVIA